MLEEFSFWLKGIIEDTPIPPEIYNLYFSLHKLNNYIFISFGGNQFEQKICLNFEFYPLEAQFFDVFKFNKNFSLLNLRNLIEKIINQPFFQNIFNGKNIFISYFGEKPHFRIEK